MAKEEKSVQEKKMTQWAYLLSAVVVLLVVLMGSPYKMNLGIDFRFLPPIYSALNAATTFVLLAAWYFIRQKNVAAHRLCINIALGASAIFLILYVLYHFTTPPTKFLGTGWIRVVYFLLLNTHIVASAIVFPLILLTFIRAYVGSFDRHKRMAKWVMPLWIYVAITGPICYILLKPYY